MPSLLPNSKWNKKAKITILVSIILILFILISIDIAFPLSLNQNTVYNGFSLFGLFNKIKSFFTKPNIQIQHQQPITQTQTSSMNAINNCKNLNLEYTAFCLNNEVKKIYKYNKERLGYFYEDKDYYDKLKQYGGTCDQWAKLYNILAKNLGFNVQEVIIFNENNPSDIRHSISIISNGNGYCIMDQNTYWCNKLKNE